MNGSRRPAPRPWRAAIAAVAMLCLGPRPATALDPHKRLTQYSRTVWAQEHGLPQDTIRAIAQTADGYLWLGTDEGLARFDGYDFVVFNKANGELPSNSITALAAVADGSLWIGTPNGLIRFHNGQFTNYTVRQGLPDDAITALYADHTGALWIVAGVSLSRFANGAFTNFPPGPGLLMTSARVVGEDRKHNLWVAGFSGVGRMTGGNFVPELDAAALGGTVVTGLLVDRHENLWVAGTNGIIERFPSGRIRRFGQADGLPDALVRAICEDRDGNIWAGTNAGVARFEGNRFVSWVGDNRDGDLVRCLFEDREGDLWIGANSGLTRLQDDVFTAYGKPEGLPSDQPNAVFQDRSGRIWFGFHDAGLVQLVGNEYRLYTPRDGMPNTEVFSIRESPQGELLIASRAGLIRMRRGHFSRQVPPDPLGRTVVFDALEDSSRRLWVATPSGLSRVQGKRASIVIPGGPLLISAIVTLSEGRDGALWAGSYGKGLWSVNGAKTRQYTVADGLSSDQIRALREDRDGTLWIGTFGGGLDALRDGRFQRFTQKDGLLSDNIASIADDGESLWLSTTRGICRIAKAQLREFGDHKRTSLDPVNYGVDEGLRSAQCAPAYPVGGGGYRLSDGRLWFTTSRGLAVFDPRTPEQTALPPAVHLVEITADGEAVDLSRPARLSPGRDRIQIRYTSVHLSAPERVRYFYKLEGLDTHWVAAGTRRVINYNSLQHGRYRFMVRSKVPGGLASEDSYAFETLPWFYETAWFRALGLAAVAALAWGIYWLRLGQIRSRFALVLQERARLAREIHDTLAQGFVGISSQLDAVALSMPDEQTPARRYLEMARRMARHSITEARRSVMDLRASVLEGQDLPAALEAGARMWTAGSAVKIDLDVTGSAPLPQEMEQHLLRIAQEAVANALKHASASSIGIMLHIEQDKLYLKIVDNGRGFEPQDAFSSLGGHFGLLGMRERAERLGGELRLASHPGEGTQVEVTVPLA